MKILDQAEWKRQQKAKPDPMVALLLRLEWAGSREVYIDDMDTDPDARLPCCPICRGFKSVPDTVEIGHKFTGYTEVTVHEDEKEEVGHRDGCALKAEIDRLSA